ncbi:peptidyl-prolyl cis-trans isomerase, rhodopsin-specific isozyme-like [Sitophilus oryzae]|uniref:Peptidyl-prolyl cis-trans isomerase n=1 Tax=Sitophilus oryzae TaxID=7048 RepID=A0A6J2YN12_SITOR|nr:peptidyl-prolyl cis-trans isomerase, rhodopsin-specific isozyme-like [Sitophilus oryzae]
MFAIRRFSAVCLVLLVINQGYSKDYKITDQIYMDIEIEGKETNRIIFGLFGEVVPKTVQNFKHLALRGIDGKSYVGTNFLIAIKKVMILGGDIVHNNGTGSLSIYGEYFDDENFQIGHDSSGLLAMVNLGAPNSNGCMFLITTMATPWLNGRHVIFGMVLKGHKVVHTIEHIKTDINDRIIRGVKIVKCGEIKINPYYENYKNYELTFWAWIKAGWFPLSWSFAIMAFFQYLIKQLTKYESTI